MDAVVTMGIHNNAPHRQWHLVGLIFTVQVQKQFYKKKFSTFFAAAMHISNAGITLKCVALQALYFSSML